MRNIATISDTPVNPLPSNDTYTSQSAHSDDAASTTDSDAPEDDDYLATVTIDVGKEGLCTRRTQIPCLSDMSTRERELTLQENLVLTNRNFNRYLLKRTGY